MVLLRLCSFTSKRFLFNRYQVLDFDGVITTPFTDWKLSNHHLGIIKFILETTGAKLIISSSWRKKDIQVTIEYLKSIGYYKPFSFPLIDHIVGQITGNDVFDTYSSRWKKINEVINYLDIPEKNYIIIDDNNFLGFPKERFVQPSSLVGITVENAVKCIQLLTENDSYNIDDILVRMIV